MKFFASFVAPMYLFAAIVVGVIHHRGHPDESFVDAVAGGLAWPSLLVEIARSPSF